MTLVDKALAVPLDTKAAIALQPSKMLHAAKKKKKKSKSDFQGMNTIAWQDAALGDGVMFLRIPGIHFKEAC